MEKDGWHIPPETRLDSVWLERQDYETAEVQYQLFLDQCVKDNNNNNNLCGDEVGIFIYFCSAIIDYLG